MVVGCDVAFQNKRKYDSKKKTKIGEGERKMWRGQTKWEREKKNKSSKGKNPSERIEKESEIQIEIWCD